MLWENFIFLYAYVNTGERLKVSSIISQLKGEKYQTQIKSKEGNNKYKSRIQWQKSFTVSLLRGLFKNNKCVMKWSTKKWEKTQITNTRNEKGGTTTDSIDIKLLIKSNMNNFILIHLITWMKALNLWKTQSKSTCEEMKNTSCPMSIKQIEFIKNFPTRKP